jgi:uncharacterized membrane protein YeaQ/YmgE (transglycosylase-associated protein family)
MLLLLAQVTTPQVVIPAITLPSIVVTIIIAALCGALAQLVVGYTHGGCLTSLLAGVIGALIGNFLASWLRMPNILLVYGVDIVWTFIGALIFVAALAVIVGGSRFRGFYRRRY